MEKITRMYLKARETVRRVNKGQTMTEYALILAAIAVVVYGAYQLLGTDIQKLVNTVQTDLTSAS